jgi:hypothetical protein
MMGKGIPRIHNNTPLPKVITASVEIDAGINADRGLKFPA